MLEREASRMRRSRPKVLLLPTPYGRHPENSDAWTTSEASPLASELNSDLGRVRNTAVSAPIPETGWKVVEFVAN